ncbi:MAG TPA: MFS transporter [Candidatus Thalassarchaeaceae archaeon]|jgi:UMF1 family MFS transporter|nr:MFS transporter [Candidatus Thalassarchaeaceae archaeon]
MYDWGKSAFETSVVSAIFPTWFAYLFLEANGLNTTIAGITMEGDALIAYLVALGTWAVAIVAPALGVIADYKPVKMTWLRTLTYVGAGATFMLGFDFLLPGNEWIWLLIFYFIANIGLNAAGVFYNALLPHLGTDDEMDDISNRAYAYGYLGGGLLLVVHLGLVLGVGGDAVIRFCLASSGVWWFGFALITFKYVPEPPMENDKQVPTIREAYSQVWTTLKEYNKFRTLFTYMLAYFFFIDAINTVWAVGPIFGAVVLGVTTTELMVTIVAIQFVAWPCALAFTKLANAWGTKKALNASLIGWLFLSFAILGFAPLELDSHEEFEVMYDWDEESQSYQVQVNPLASQIAQKLDFGDDEFDEQKWASDFSGMLPVEFDDKTNTYKWADGYDDSDDKLLFPVEGDVALILASISESRFSISVSGGPLDGSSDVGIDHPTSLGDGALDVIPETVREHVWEPLGIAIGMQFLILGCMIGTLFGGSQGLSRSIFGQMIPETRSTEFFGFFGFFGKVAAAVGPLLYATMTIMFDSRVGVLSIAVLIAIGVFLMRYVDIEQGRADARAEDAKNRGISTDS